MKNGREYKRQKINEGRNRKYRVSQEKVDTLY
jgi:hypothetical protein